ncbi:YueI family protein [Salinibacillus xinjiangensis]|uniref:DUF1694 domain-containing protein n=1 Tax=Salinibacillus xinjiangensis TaxID=1229268 RepID=A0A6G1X939_9BACI|nr:YueI family protein [Salinibacillus xinjiangensis]MRG87318.1 DUF1694 domain-containing protein [Salinibacillus xinjiangensis]
MGNDKMDEYLQEGIYGKKETNPDERRRYLGSLRERVVLALTKGQVMKKRGLQELENAIKEYPDAQLLLNGRLRSSYFNPFKKLAQKYNIHYTSVTNKNAKTDLGLLLVLDYAVELENIFIKEEEKNEKIKEERNRFTSFLKYIFTGSKD